MSLVDMRRTREIGDVEGIEFKQAVGAITASSFSIFDFRETAPFATYAPFDELRIANGAAETFKAYINQNPDKYEIIFGNTEKAIKGINLYTLKFENISGTASSADEVWLTVVKQGIVADTLAKRLARKVGDWL